MFLGKKQNPYTIEGRLPKWKNVKRLKDKNSICEVEKHKDILGERFIPFMFDDVKDLFCIDKNNNHIMIVFVDTGECGLVTLNLETFVGTLEVYYE